MKKIIFLILMIIPFIVYSQSDLSITGQTFGDYFYKFSGDSTGTFTEYSQYPKDFQAFDIRRIYLGFNYNISDRVAANLLLESGNKILTSSRFGFFIKIANVELKNVIPNSSMYIGIAPTFSYAIPEKIWNYRPVDKTITDMRGFTSASDLGVSIRGTFDKEGNYGYGFMIGNGSYQKPEINKYKRFYADLFFKPLNGLTLDLYSDFENGKYDKNKLLYKAMIAYQQPNFAIGVEAFQQNQYKAFMDSIDVVPRGISTFGWLALYGLKPEKYPKINLFGRFDYYDPDSELDNAGFKEMFITGGLDFEVFKDVHFMPNIWVNTYSDKSTLNIERKSDLVGRMTFYYQYK